MSSDMNGTTVQERVESNGATEHTETPVQPPATDEERGLALLKRGADALAKKIGKLDHDSFRHHAEIGKGAALYLSARAAREGKGYKRSLAVDACERWALANTSLATIDISLCLACYGAMSNLPADVSSHFTLSAFRTSGARKLFKRGKSGNNAETFFWDDSIAGAVRDDLTALIVAEDWGTLETRVDALSASGASFLSEEKEKALEALRAEQKRVKALARTVGKASAKDVVAALHANPGLLASVLHLLSK